MHVLARLMAAGTVAMLVFLAPAASAQVEVPPAPDPGPCVSDPGSCISAVPPPPDLDPCLQDPASCVPSVPDPDACVQDPTSCVSLTAPGPGTDTRGELGPISAEPGEPPAEKAPPPVVGGVRRERPESGSGRTEPSGRGPVDAASTARTATPLDVVPAPQAGPDSDLGVGDLAQAVQDFAFPLLLIAAVSVFLGIQSRVDRRDPKLALAPVNSRHDVVEFR